MGKQPKQGQKQVLKQKQGVAQTARRAKALTLAKSLRSKQDQEQSLGNWANCAQVPGESKQDQDQRQVAPVKLRPALPTPKMAYRDSPMRSILTSECFQHLDSSYLSKTPALLPIYRHLDSKMALINAKYPVSTHISHYNLPNSAIASFLGDIALVLGGKAKSTLLSQQAETRVARSKAPSASRYFSNSIDQWRSHYE